MAYEKISQLNDGSGESSDIFIEGEVLAEDLDSSDFDVMSEMGESTLWLVREIDEE